MSATTAPIDGDAAAVRVELVPPAEATVIHPDEVRHQLESVGADGFAASLEPHHLVEAVRFLGTVDCVRVAGLVEQVLGCDEIPWALTTPSTRGARIGVDPRHRDEVP